MQPAHHVLHISINNLIFKLSAAKKLMDCSKMNSIKSERYGALMKNLHLVIPQFFLFDETLTIIVDCKQ